MNTQVSPPPAPDNGNVSPPVAPPALTAEQSQQWEAMRTQLAGGTQDRATALQSFASPDALFERITAEPQVKPPSWDEISWGVVWFGYPSTAPDTRSPCQN